MEIVAARRSVPFGVHYGCRNESVGVCIEGMGRMKFAYEDGATISLRALIVLFVPTLARYRRSGIQKGRMAGVTQKFVGTAELHPSKAAPWVGNSHCSG